MPKSLGSLALMSIVKVKENNVAQEFYVVRHNAYTNGRTLLLRRYTHSDRQWHNANVNTYASGTLDAWFNGEYFNSLAADVRGQIAAVTIPYIPGNNNWNVSNLSRKVFAVSGTELGQSHTYMTVEGTALANASTLKIATDSGGNAKNQWTRSPITYNTYSAWNLGASGSLDDNGCASTYSARPAFTLPSSLGVDDNGNVVANTPPTVPPSIAVPTEVRGGTPLSISWGTSTDEENNLSGYILERQYNDGSWVQIYKGINRAFTDAITFGWANVAYRVKAYDSVGSESAYQTSATRTVINNTAPTISGSDSNLGVKTAAFNQAYTITDVDAGQIITVVEKMDGVQTRSYTATSGQGYSFNVTAAQWREILNGSRTMTITATDNYGGTVTRTYTFSKNETEIELTLATPLAADDMVPKAIMSVTRQLPQGATFTIEVCNNGNDAAPTWEDVTQAVTSGNKFFLANKTKTAAKWGFNFRIKINRNGAAGECYIVSIGGNFE